MRHRHLVQSKRAGLVATHNRSRTERFDGGQTFDQRILFRHSLNAERHDDRRRSGQSLGNYRYRKRYSEEYEVVPFAVNTGIEKTYHHYCDTDDHSDERKYFADGIEFLFYRSLEVVLGL